MDEILKFVALMGVGIRHPHDEFLKEGNLDCQLLRPYGICDYDNEEFYHKPYPRFSCHIPGCDRTFETVMEYESHYNSCHSFTCNECNKNLPNYHLLDLHISETHDSFFLEMAKRKPMFQCFVQECKEVFVNPKVRLDHCVTVHKYPSNFRYDAFKKLKNSKKNRKKKNVQEKMDTDQNYKCSGSSINVPHQDNQCSSMDVVDQSSQCSSMEVLHQNGQCSSMEILENENLKIKNKNKNYVKKEPTVLFGASQKKRKSVFHNFSKDLINVLPKT